MEMWRKKNAGKRNECQNEAGGAQTKSNDAPKIKENKSNEIGDKTQNEIIMRKNEIKTKNKRKCKNKCKIAKWSKV